MLDSLTNRLTGILDRLRGFGRLTEENIQEALREVRVALLEADVNFKVVKGFIDRVRVKAVGQDVLQSLTPGQQVVKVVRDELVELLGGSAHRLAMAPHPPTVVMLVGLQGSGKTTSAAKLARHFQKQGQHPLLAAADVYRPAAVDQLKTLGAQLGIPVVGEATQRPVEICAAARDEAARRGLSPLILDTAGRLHIDEEMLEELRAIKRAVGPHHVLLVVDAMTGQDAVTVAEKFNAAIGIDAVVLTKMDGDARGGAALSVRQVTGRPIAFVGVGEKTEALEPFHPDRLAQRILGMGDVLSLVEKAQATVDAGQAEALAQKIHDDTFTLEDFATQLRQLRSMGPLGQLMDMVPFFKGARGLPKEMTGEEQELDRYTAIIGSMTPHERREPSVINGSRRARIARGSGTNVSDVNRLLKQYGQLRKMMKGLKNMEGRMGKFKGALPFLADLMRQMPIPLALDFLEVSSYGEATESSGVVRILKDLAKPIEGRDVVVVEDILDTGHTLAYVIEHLRSKQPASVRLCTLLDKPARRIVPIQIDYRGFEIPDKFVVGYGLDYAERYRNLPFIGVLKPEVYRGEP